MQQEPSLLLHRLRMGHVTPRMFHRAARCISRNAPDVSWLRSNRIMGRMKRSSWLPKTVYLFAVRILGILCLNVHRRHRINRILLPNFCPPLTFTSLFNIQWCSIQKRTTVEYCMDFEDCIKFANENKASYSCHC